MAEHTHHGHKQHIGLGILFSILAAISFTLMSLLGKIIGDRASTDTIVFARFFISLALILPWIIKNPRIVIAKHPSKMIMRSVFSLLAFVCFFYVLKFISLADALILNNTYPLFIPLTAWCITKSTTPPKVWIGILLGFIGVVLILKPDTQFFEPASLFGLVSGAFAAVAIVLIRQMTKSISTVQILFYNFFICSLLTGIFLPFHFISLSSETLYLLLGVGIFGASYQLFSTLSFAKAPVRLTSPIMYLCIVFGVIADFFIWKNIPDFLSAIGMICVIAGGSLTIYLGKGLISPPPGEKA